MLFTPSAPAPAPVRLPVVTYDAARRSATVENGSGTLRLGLNFAAGCVVETMRVRGREVLAPGRGIRSGIHAGGAWSTTTMLAQSPEVTRERDRLRITGIAYVAGTVRVVESWTFTAKADAISWRIDRRYESGGVLEDTSMPSATFASMDTWTGALLGTGGVAWGKLLDAPNATYGVHTGSATLWDPATDACLRFEAIDKAPSRKALRFNRESDGTFSMTSAVTTEARTPKYGKSRFLRDRQDVWSPFEVKAGQEVNATFELRAPSYRAAYGRGEFKGFDTGAITELLNTIGRIGVIDEGLVGSNGWYSGYICMHEPWLARVGTAINDPNYLRASAAWLDYARAHAIAPDGMVKSRWKYDAGDAQPGTYDDASGFYEAQWGRLMDSQSSYVTNVADQFDASGDRAWVIRQKEACERALEYLLRRDGDGDGLVEMENRLTGERRSSDWLDIVWAAHENAFVNAQLYGALIKWAAVERHLGDAPKAKRYAEMAHELKTSFNRPVAEGGFFNPAKGWYVYWRDADGSVHGDNLTVPVNLTAIGEGICDDPVRRKILLDTMEARMKAESLLSWPACFESYAPGEGKDDVFPTYENGDVFLAWAEYGVRAYAPTQPQVALKYVRQIVDRYKADGLAFQRYLRKDGRGTGDDILANNCNVMTGLYRDVYGIQPKFNRLLLDPHLVPELDGTTVRYDLRGRPLTIDLSTRKYGVTSKGMTLRSNRMFGVDFGPNGATYFPERSDVPALTVGGASGVPLVVTVHDWRKSLRWTVSAGAKTTTALHTFPNLSAGATYLVIADGREIARVDAKTPTVRIPIKAGKSSTISLVARG